MVQLQTTKAPISLHSPSKHSFCGQHNRRLRLSIDSRRALQSTSQSYTTLAPSREFISDWIQDTGGLSPFHKSIQRKEGEEMQRLKGLIRLKHYSLNTKVGVGFVSYESLRGFSALPNYAPIPNDHLQDQVLILFLLFSLSLDNTLGIS